MPWRSTTSRSCAGTGRGWPGLLAPTGVSHYHGKGLVLQAHRDGRIETHGLLTHCWSAGLALFVRPDDPGIVMDFPHHKIWQRMPFVNLTDAVMFIRGDHATNDARTPFAAAAPLPIPEAEIPEILARRFAIDIGGFRAAWAGLAHP